MRVLFDYQAFEMQTHGGVSRCFWELYKHLPENVDAQICIKESNNAHLQLSGVRPIGYEYNHFISRKHFYGKGRLFEWYNKLRGCNYRKLNQVNMIERLQKGNFDVFHPTYFQDYFLKYLNGKPFVLTIHDMIPELYPQFFKEDDLQIVMKKRLAPLASAIVAVSERTKMDILRFIDVPEDKIHVIYHGANFVKPTNECSLFSFPYILYVGDRWGYKRFKEWMVFVANFLKKHSDIKVICTGKPFSEDEIYLMEKLGIKNSFIQYFVQKDIDFYSIYHNAIAFVYTSEYEGFGIPILEAYHADCPVLINRASCFPEVAGDAAVYFSMTDRDSDFADKLEMIYNFTPQEKGLLLQKQRTRLQLYSWEKSARQLAEVYKRVLDRSSNNNVM